MTKLTAMPIQGKTLLKFFFSGTAEIISMKLDMWQLELEDYNVFINHDHVMTIWQILRQGQLRSPIAESC